MTTPDPIQATFDDLSIDAKNLTRSTVNAFRAAFGIAGIVSLILGIVLLVWPDKSVQVVAIFLGIYFVVAGVIRLAVGIFSKGISGGKRTLDIIFGLLLLIAGIIALKNIDIAAASLLILVVAIIGVSWLIEGVLALVESGNAASRGWAITFGIISILAGIVVLVTPLWSAVALILFSGIALVVLGIVGIVRAFTFGRGLNLSS